jgi:DNA-binding NarL/FixJ family response regulator
MKAVPGRNKSAAKMPSISIVLVDDHPLLREGLAQLLATERDLALCGQAGEGAEAIETIGATSPDLVIVDISLPGRDGIDLIREIKARFPNLPILVFSMHDELLYAERALQAGAKGYVMKSRSPEYLLLAIRRVLAGEIVVGTELVARLLHRVAQAKPNGSLSILDLLTNRELEIFRRIGAGHQRGRMASELNLSVKTIEAHRANIRQKLGLRNAADLMQHAIHFVQREAAGPQTDRPLDRPVRAARPSER